MAAVKIVRNLLECDGCKVVFGVGRGHASPAEARAAAYAAGWRFPPKLTSKGAPSSVVSDVCPACAPAWNPEQWRGTGRQRILSQAEAARLLGENDTRHAPDDGEYPDAEEIADFARALTEERDG